MLKDYLTHIDIISYILLSVKKTLTNNGKYSIIKTIVKREVIRMDFPKVLKRCQYERHMTNDAFAKYLGKSRAWLQGIYTTNPKVKKYLIGERTIFDLNEKLGIPTELIEEYNQLMSKREVE